MSDTNTRVKERINFCIKEGLWEQVPKFFAELHPADIGEIINNANPHDQTRLFDLIADDIKPDVLAELDDRAGADILEDMTAEEISDIVEEMAPDDAADVLGEMEKERSAEILNLMENTDSEEVRELLQYDEDTAGGIMTTDFVAAHSNMTAAEAIEYIGSLDLDEPFYNLYVIDSENRLIGWVQIWELLKKTNRNLPLSKIANDEPIYVHTNADQEEVARIAAKYDLSSLPVLDWQNKLVGRITVDDIMDVIEEEASEDIFKLAGSSDVELEDISPFSACRARLPWLLITLATGFITSTILTNFDQHLKVASIGALIAFVPIILGMGGNTGIQSSTLIIRGIALGASHSKRITRIIVHEMITGTIMGVICGSAIGLWADFLLSGKGTHPGIAPAYLALTVAVALFSAMTFAAVFGALVPVLLDRIKIDPAIASGPFVTSSNDIFALLIYYGVTIAMIGATHLN